MAEYYCSTCGRHLFSYEQNGTFRIVIKCKRCGITNSISFGNVFIKTETTFLFTEVNALGIF